MLEILFFEIAKDPAFYIPLNIPRTDVTTVIDGRTFDNRFWQVESDGEGDRGRRNYWAPDVLAKRIIDVLASGASEVEFIKNLGEDYESRYVFDVRGSREALQPVVAACR